MERSIEKESVQLTVERFRRRGVDILFEDLLSFVGDGEALSFGDEKLVDHVQLAGTILGWFWWVPLPLRHFLSSRSNRFSGALVTIHQQTKLNP